MFRSWKFLFLLVSAIFVLGGCGKSIDQKAEDGIAAARDIFEQDGKNATEEIDGVSLYKPVGFTIEDASDPQNIILSNKDETFILFINPNEEKDSHLFHDLLKAQENIEVIKEETFTDKGFFGFASVLKSGDDKVELVTSVGGVKMTTITKEKNIEHHMANMMEIVRSVKQPD
ncbi:hypothetical protein [Sporosarcina sp. Te-1]|uniref:hypothetical protein n=1 Tax=Sporosarcina sp. Te-1 TaxID=2818390 RepID=UPI001A9E415E|nr:hypothetical protein [Sporosarcina sp. Te-1]QTD41383.1 hypothetical protein J3U78_00475 [Sporosarcina sp. Te-1]